MSRNDEPKRARTAAEWNERYLHDELPWDLDRPSPHLVAFVDALGGTVNSALDLGCGTGANALWLASRGISVVAVDIAARAIELARARAADAGLDQHVSFAEHDVIERAPVEDGTVDLVFDRGMFHSVSEDQRPVVVRRAHDALVPGGRWLTLIGNADEENPGKGPRRLTAREVTTAVEPLFRVISLRAERMDVRAGSVLIWRGVFERR